MLQMVTAHFLVLPAGDRVEGGAAVCPSRFPLCLLTRCGSISASKVIFDAEHIQGLQGIFFFSFVPQVAEKVKTAVREVEDALQLLQEQVTWRLSDCLLSGGNEDKMILKCWFHVCSCLRA